MFWTFLDEKALSRALNDFLHVLLPERFLLRGAIIFALWKSVPVSCVPFWFVLRLCSTSFWYLNFSVQHSQAVQNIYKSGRGTVIINLTNFASEHNNNNDKKRTKIGVRLLFRTMFLSVRWGGTRVCDLWNRSSSRKQRMFLMRCQIRRNCGHERCWIYWVTGISSPLRRGMMLCIKKKSKCWLLFITSFSALFCHC